jgi:ADP-ribose pyrophosphatase
VKLVSSKEVYKSKIFTVTEERATAPDGFEIERAIVQHNGAAVMMAMDGRKRILLVRQYRMPARKRLWELPAGRIDPGETPLKAARRELKEETGYRAGRWKKLISFYPSPGFCAEKMTIYLATELDEGEPEPMDDERIETRWFSSKKVDEMIRKGQIIDAKTIAGYLFWRRTNCPFGR